MRKITRVFFTLFLMILFVSFSFSLANAGVTADPKTSAVLKGGGGAVGGIGFMVMTGMAKVVKEAFPRIDITIVPGGWVGNLPRCDKGELDLGSTTIAMCSLAEAKKYPFEKPLPSIRALYTTQDKLYYFLIVRRDLEADSIMDIIRKKLPVRLNVLQKGTTVELMWRTIFKSQGVKFEDINAWGGKINYVTWGDGVNLIKDGHADGTLSVGVRKIGWAMDLTHARNMKILKWDENLVSLMKEKFGFAEGHIPANTYKGITTDTRCPTDGGEIIVNSRVSDDVVIAILQALADNAESYQKFHSALLNFKSENMAKGLKLPLHKAALEFYKDRAYFK